MTTENNANIFETATRKGLTFDSPKGQLIVQDLWKLQLTSTRPDTPNLDSVARGLYKQLKTSDEQISFVNPPSASVDDDAQIKFDIVKHIIAIKVTERADAADAAKKAETKQKILAALERKQNDKLESLSEEEMREMLKTL